MVAKTYNMALKRLRQDAILGYIVSFRSVWVAE